jgi:hypothetical protein
MIGLLACFPILTLEQLYAEAANREREQSEANNRDDDAGQQRWPETDARQQCRKHEEHRQRRDNIPERIPRVIGDLFLGLVLDVQPDKRQNGYEGQRSDKSAEFIAALRKLGYEHDNCGSQKIFRDEPGHDFSKASNDTAEKVSSAHPAANQMEYQAEVPVLALTEPNVPESEYFTGVAREHKQIDPVTF